MIGIIDYGRGNLASVEKALNTWGYETVISGDRDILNKCSGYILPGVGAFTDGMEALRNAGMDTFLKEIAFKKPLLGICLGMQLLFDYGEENGGSEGLGFLRGSVKRLTTPYKIPHMGWNDLMLLKEDPLLSGIEEGDSVYFVHSYRAFLENEEDLKAYVDYGEKIPAVVGENGLWGMQFHPEKSARIGMKMIKNFGELVNQWS